MNISLSSLAKRLDNLEEKFKAIAPKSSRFIDNGNGTITDKETNLTWQKDTDGKERRWEEAKKYCENNEAKLPGGGWRLPTVKELMSIVDYERHNPAIDPIFGCKGGYYWSSTPCAGSAGGAWYVYFSYGSVYRGSQYYGRCVRSVRRN